MRDPDHPLGQRVEEEEGGRLAVPKIAVQVQAPADAAAVEGKETLIEPRWLGQAQPGANSICRGHDADRGTFHSGRSSLPARTKLLGASSIVANRGPGWTKENRGSLAPIYSRIGTGANDLTTRCHIRG